MDSHLVYRGKSQINPNVELWDTHGTYLVDCETVPWTEVGEGQWVKLLNFDPAIAKYTILYKARAGTVVTAHKHIGATEFFVLQGTFGYEAGEVGPGGYGYEYPYAVHEPIVSSDVDLVMLVINYGATVYYNEDGTPGRVSVVDHTIEACRRNNATAHLEPYLPFPPRNAAAAR